MDRQIVAALVRNGRASWRLIAEVLGQQERTIARRGNRLLESGMVRTNSFINPSAVSRGSPFLLRVQADPASLRAAAVWLADRAETTWVSALAGASECVAELFLPVSGLGSFLYGELAAVEGVRSFTMSPMLEYFRTPSGWQPDILDAQQYAALRSGDETGLSGVGDWPEAHLLDESNRILAQQLQRNGRATLDELAAATGLSKATVGRRLDAMTASGTLFIRAVVDPEKLGLPVEALVSITISDNAQPLGRDVALLPVTRWAAASEQHVHAQVAVRSIQELANLLAGLRSRDDVAGVASSVFAEVFKRSTIKYRDGAPDWEAGSPA